MIKLPECKKCTDPTPARYLRVVVSINGRLKYDLPESAICEWHFNREMEDPERVGSDIQLNTIWLYVPEEYIQ